MKEHGFKRLGNKWRVLSVILAVVLLVGLVAAGLVQNYLNKINRYTDQDDYTMSLEEIQQMEEEILREEADDSWENDASTSTEPGQQPTDAPPQPSEWEDSGNKPDREVVNILLIGQDRLNTYERARSDTMILCSINKSENTVTMTSFMRDLYVHIPGYGDNRLNATYPIGGMKLLNATLKENFGVEVDANIEVDFTGFSKIVDVMGGVDIVLTEAEVDYMAYKYHYDHLKPGINHLNGEEALGYSRIRYIDSDFQRTNRQRKVVNTLIDSVRSADMGQLVSLLDTILPLIKTDMTNGQITGYFMEFFPMLRNCKIISQRVPLDNGFEYDRIRGMSVIKAFPNMTRALLDKTTK